MGIRTTPDFTALNYGEISPRLRGRADLDFYDQALDYLQNYIVTSQGEISFRNGSVFVANTRDNKVARLLPFLFNTEQAYIVEMTEGYMRFYKDRGLITQTAQDITGITQANPAVVTYVGADNYANGDRIVISGVSGMHQINNREYIVAGVNTGANTFQLQDVGGNNINSTGYSSYASGGSVSEVVEIASPYLEAELFAVDFTQTNDTMYMVHPSYEPRKLTRSSHTSWSIATFSRTSDPFTGANEYPSTVTLFEGRIIYGASNNNPTRLWFSKLLPNGSLDDFTTGTNDDDAIIYNVRADQANRIRWIAGAENYIALGTSGSEFRISGGGENNAITPTNISIKPTSFNGVAAIRPIRLDSYILYVQRNGRTVRSFEYNALQDGYVSPDRTLLADHIGKSKFKQFSFTAGTPNIIWGVRNDGKMMGLTFDPSQQVVAWHPHVTDGLFLSVATIPEANDDDELWTCVERNIGGQTVRYIEYTPNAPDIPVPEDYFTDEDSEEEDTDEFLAALWNVQKTIVHSDASLEFDGRLATAGIDLTISGGLETDDIVTITASGNFFTASMADDLRRIQSPRGGQIEITGYTSATEVEGVVLYKLEADEWEGGTWAYMARGLGGLWHLEGETIALLVDGGVVEGRTVTNGEIEFDDDAGYAIVGLIYNGIGKTQDITGGSEIGRGQAQPKSITHIGVRFRASLGTKFGTSLYNLEHPPFREYDEVSGRPPRLFDGILKINIPDSWSETKNLYWLHNTPTPSNIQYIQPLMETNER